MQQNKHTKRVRERLAWCTISSKGVGEKKGPREDHKMRSKGSKCGENNLEMHEIRLLARDKTIEQGESAGKLKNHVARPVGAMCESAKNAESAM
jgi:hypothetical protein